MINSTRLLRAMNRCGFTQKEFAEKVGVAEVTVSRWVHGTRNPRRGTLQKMADVLGCGAGYLSEPDRPEGELTVSLDAGAFPPERAYPTDAGLDLRSPVDALVPALGSAVIDTGVHVRIPEGCAGVLVSKSGLNVLHNITSTGLIDEGYTGSIRVKLYNHGDKGFLVERGNKISQLMIQPVWRETVVRVVEDVRQAGTDGSGRGDNGFGSSGR